MPNKALKEYPPEVLRTRVLTKVKELQNGCWEWQGAVRSGYPAMEVGKGAQKRQIYAHRLVWVLYHGELPRGSKVAHECGDALCVNPAHLGLYRASGWARVGGKRGESHWLAKLDADKVRKIRRRHKNTDETFVSIARDFDVSPDCVANVCKRRTWKHVR